MEQLNIGRELAITLLKENNWDIFNAIMSYDADKNLSDVQIAETRCHQSMPIPHQSLAKAFRTTSHTEIIGLTGVTGYTGNTGHTGNEFEGYDQTFTRGVYENDFKIEKQFKIPNPYPINMLPTITKEMKQ